jgi:competence protein ComEA
MQKRASSHYFNFTRKERNGTVVLLIVILLLSAFPFIYPFVFKEKTINDVDIQKEIAILKTKQQDSTKNYYRGNSSFDHDRYDHVPPGRSYQHDQIKGELFYFDPNTISAAGWKKLGLREKTINTIQNFISKGGKFRQPDDIRKIWGLHEDEVQRLLPFVKINEAVSITETVRQSVSYNNPESKRSVGMVDINLADTNALIRLPGIGSKLSNRIINFRDKLGGFYSIDQVAETFGLPDSVFQKIKPLLLLRDKNLKQQNINTASADELKLHPYIRYNLAGLIVQYRTQHGNFSAVSDIKKIMTVTDELYNRLYPYLTIQ